MLQQYLPFTVLKPWFSRIHALASSRRCNSTYRSRYWNSCRPKLFLIFIVATVPTVHGIETPINGLNKSKAVLASCNSTYRSRYWNPVLNRIIGVVGYSCNSTYRSRYWNISASAILFSTYMLQQHLPFTVLKRCFNNLQHFKFVCCRLQQSLPFTVCAEGCEAAEAQSDDAARTSQVPERREGKTKIIKQ